MPPLQFPCTLCGKTYSRAHDLATHENSYDHLHKKRLKEMRAMTTHRPTAKVASEKAERRRREGMDVLGSNLVRQADTPRRKGVVKDAGKKVVEEEGEGEVEVVAALQWERLGELRVGELGEVQGDVKRMAEGREGWRALREDKSWVEEIWRDILAGNKEEKGESPGSPQALGLGA